MTNPQSPPFDAEKKVGQYVALRDALRALDAQHEENRKKLLEPLEIISGQLQGFIDANKISNLKTKAGTCYVSTRYTASLADPDAFMKYVIAHGKFDLLDRRANATAVREFTEQTKGLPPGCNLNALSTLGVRRPTGKSGETT